MLKFIQGQRCYLRGLTLQDAEGDYLVWLNDFEVTRFLEVGRKPIPLEALQDLLRHVMTEENSVWLAICDQETDKHIGNIVLHSIHPVHRRANLGIMIGDRAAWGKGFATEATDLVVNYAFRRLNLNSIWLGVLADHSAAIKVYEKVGFRVDGREREAWWADGAFHDVLHMSILAREYWAVPPKSTF